MLSDSVFLTPRKAKNEGFQDGTADITFDLFFAGTEFSTNQLIRNSFRQMTNNFNKMPIGITQIARVVIGVSVG
jgi:hypothetical protein